MSLRMLRALMAGDWRSSIRRQAILLVAAIVVVGGVLTALATQLALQSSQAYARVDTARQQQTRVAALAEAMTNQSASLRAYELTADPRHLPLYLSSRRDVPPLLLELERDATPRTAATVGPMKIRITVWEAWAEELRARVAAGGPVTDPALDQEGSNLIESVRFSERAAEVAGQRDAEDQLAVAHRAELTLASAASAGVPLCVFLVLLLGTLLVRSTLAPILDLVVAAEQLARGEPAAIPVPSRRDEVGRLATALAAWHRVERQTERIVADLNAVSTTVERADLLELACQRLLEELGADQILIGLEEGDRWRVAAAAPRPLEAALLVTAGPAAVREIAENGHFRGESRTGFGENTPLAAWCAAEGLGPLLALPLVSGGRRLGSAAALRRHGREDFSRIEFNRAEIMLPQIAAALQVAGLFTELRAANEAIRLADRHKSEFVAGMSHELRTPLNSILGFSQLLLEHPDMAADPARRHRYLDNIQTSGKHLLGLINDILDLSKIEAGRMEIRVDSLCLREVVDEVMATMAPLAAAKGVGLHAACPDALQVRADGTRLRQILLNLLSNAIKFTPEGGRVRLACHHDGRATVMAVTDTGIGIPQDQQASVFREFHQLEAGRSKGNQGTGLGLALTRRFAELHGGSVELCSTPGVGSTFTVRLPGPATAGARPAAVASAVT